MRSSLLFAVGALLLAAASVWPALAVPVAWPFLFVVPGWLLAARVTPSLAAPGRLGIGVVASIYLSAHLVNLGATLGGGLSADLVLAVTALLLALSVALVTLDMPWLAPPPRLSVASAVAALRRDRTAWLLAVVAVAIVGGVLAASAWHLTSSGWVSGGWNWSDFLVHVAIGASLSQGNFPPQVPYFAGVPLAYHWFTDFHGAIAALVAGIGVIPVFVLTNALMAGVLALLVWLLALRLTDDRRVATIAAVLAVFGGGLGWIRLPLDLLNGQGDLATLIATTPYDNTWAGDWPHFTIGSVFGTGLLAHRATALGLPGLVGVVLLVHESLGRRPAGMALAGVLAALLAPFNFFVFPATYLVVLLMVLGRREWRRPTWRRDAVLFILPVVAAAPFVIGPSLLQQGSGALHFVVGWDSAPLADGPLAVTFFYLTNLGVPVLLALVAVVQRGVPARAFLAAWAIALFAVPNVLVLSVVTFDMNRYFQVMWVAVAVLAAWAIRRWPMPIVAGVVGLSVLSPLLVAAWFVTSTTVALSAAQERAATWIEANTPERSVFITDAFINSSVDLAGRLRVTTFGPYVANLGYDPDQRAADVHAVYCDGDAAAAAIMDRYGASYVLSSGGLLECGGRPATDFDQSARFRTVYANESVAIWQVTADP